MIDTIIVRNNDSESKVELENYEVTSTKLLEKFCRLLILQNYQIDSVIDSLNIVRQDLIEEVKRAHENFSDK